MTKSSNPETKGGAGKDIHAVLATKTLHWTKRGVVIGIIIGAISILVTILIAQGIIGPAEKTKTIPDQPTQTESQKILTAPDSANSVKKEIMENTTVPFSKMNQNTIIIKPTIPITVNHTQSNSIPKDITADETNNYINITTTKSDIAVLVIDNNNNPINSISSEIASLYRTKGYSVTTSLFTNSFITSGYLNEVRTANSRIIDKLRLASQVNYIIIAKYSNNFEPGGETKWISRANLDVTVTSCASKSQQDAFLISVSSGFDDQQHAETGAKEKIITSFKASHLNL